MTTYTAITTLTGKEPAEQMGLAMENMIPEPMGIGVFEMEDGSGLWEVGAYFDELPDQTELDLLAAAFGSKAFVVSEVPETDWVSHVRRELTPVEAGRFFVYGSHDADKVPEGCEPLLIEAAMAFGTGHHGTTLGCLKALDRLANNGFHGHNVADIGCGTAVLAMAAARIWPENVIASDIDEVAVDVALANAEANDLKGRIHCVEAAGFDHPDLKSRAPFDLVFANILKGPLFELGPDMAEHIAPSGYAILSGLLVEQAEEIIARYDEVGFELEYREDLGEWSALTLKRR